MESPGAAKAGGTQVPARRVYRRPPVVEAVLDIQVRPKAGVGLPELARVQQGLEAQYSRVEPMLSGSVKLDAASGAVVETSQAMVGYRFSDPASSAFVQAKAQGFTYSRLAPYTGWEQWSAEAKLLWQRYVKEAEPAAVHRLAVRYINKIEYPRSETRKIRDYLRVFPEVPTGIPGGVAGLLMRLELRNQDVPDGLLILSIGRTEPSKPENVALLLDLDVIQTTNLRPDNPMVWEVLESLHERENEYFEACITDLARELFS